MLNRYDIKTDEYQKQEEQMQEEIIDNDKRKFYSKQYEYMIKSEEIKQIIKDIKKLNKDNVELIDGIKKLNEKIEQKDKLLQEQNLRIQQLEQETVRNKIVKTIKQKINKKG